MKPEMTSEEEAFETTKKFREDCLLFGPIDLDRDKAFKAIVDDNFKKIKKYIQLSNEYDEFCKTVK